MTRRAGGAESRPADQTHHRYTTPPPRRRACEQKRQIPARPSAARSTSQPAQSVPIGQHRTSRTGTTPRHSEPDAGELYRAWAILLTRRATHASNYRARREAKPRTRYGGTRGHLGRGRGTHKQSIFKPGTPVHCISFPIALQRRTVVATAFCTSYQGIPIANHCRGCRSL